MKIIDARCEGVGDVVEQGARVVFSGGTIVYPDETGYRFGCDPQHGDAVERILSFAGEQDRRDVELCVGSAAELLEYAPNDALVVLALKHGRESPLALLLKRPTFLTARGLAASERVAFRVPREPLARALLERCGPLLTCDTAYAGGGSEGLPSSADLVVERGEVAPRLEVSLLDPMRITSEP